MAHAGEGELQAYLDGEVDSATAVALRDHVVGCATCAGELESLQHADGRVRELLGLLDADVTVPVLRARAEIARRGRRGWRGVSQAGVRSLAKAAALLLVLGGAAAAAIPEVRQAIESVITSVAERLGVESDVAVEPSMTSESAPEVPTGLSFIAPVAGRIRVVLHSPAGRIDVVARIVDADRARVETAMEAGPVRLRSGSGRLELVEPGAGSLTIEIPRSVRNASVEIDGRVWVHKEGDILSVSGPGVEDRGSEVRFTIDP